MPSAALFRAIHFAFIMPLAMFLTVDVSQAQSLPLRKAGLWELRTSMDQGNGPRKSSLKICIDGEMEQQTVLASIREHQENCSRYEIKTLDNGIVVEGECVFNNARVNSRTEMSGDFKTAFTVKIDTTTVRQGASQSMSVRRQITQSGTYLGTSCNDLKPGEAVGEDGNKVYVQ